MEKRIYLDYAATAPVRPEVVKVMKPYFSERFGNAASIHRFGQQAQKATDEARRKVAEILNCKPLEIIFTSSGTEADNLAIYGLAKNYPDGHIITTTIEHKAALETCRALGQTGLKVTYIKPNQEGIVSVEQITKAITPKTFLVSIMYANNEVGTIQPIREIGLMLKRENQKRKQPIYFHTDAVQAGNLLSLDTQILHTDMLTLSGHKLGGPKGVGLLYVRDGVPLQPIIYGGGQERGLRSGSLNVPGIVGLATALEMVQRQKPAETKRLSELQKYLIKELRKLPQIEFNGSLTSRLVNNLNFSVKGKTSDELVIGLDRRGIAVSAASACAAGSVEPSYVLLAMGLNATRANSSVRITLGYLTKKPDLVKLAKELKQLAAN
ncbi:MAG: cysteine desulfurase family protein [Patescibacteria group bacterium]